MIWSLRHKLLINLIGVATVFGQMASDSTSVIKVGPIIDKLPLLDSLAVVVDSTDEKQVPKVPTTPSPKSYPINASGSFFRSVEMSSQGAGGLGGGLRFQLAGKLSEKINVSGTVTDESIPIQPDGTTATLEELDKVYLNVSHPAGEVTAGDISLNNNIGKYNNNNRKIIGIKNNINYKDTEFETVIGQSKGRYHRLEIKGRDGHQGPYFLTSKSGERHVIIAAGSETIWLNGVELKRGADRDYVIDYTAGELTFTPKHLIYFDTDIDMEYQYRSTQYKTNYIGADMSGTLGENGQFHLAYVDERDDQGSSLLTADHKILFKTEDQVYRSGVVADSLGDYELIQSIYYYRPTTTPSRNRYTINFSPSTSGEYVRKISDQNRIYYEFVATDGIDHRQRYAPGQSIQAPGSHQMLQLDTTFPIKEGLTLSTEGAFTVLDDNVFSKQKSSQFNGNAFRVTLDQQSFQVGKASIEMGISHWQNGEDFRAMGRERAVDFNESWDVIENEGVAESMSSFRTGIKFDSGFDGRLNLSRLDRGGNQKQRSEMDLRYKGGWINSANIRWNQVQSDQTFREMDGQIRLFNGPVKPYLSLIHELREDAYRFDDVTVGVNYKTDHRSISIGVGQRTDLLNKSLIGSALGTAKTGKTLQLDYTERSPSGWRQSWLYRRRFQDDKINNTTNDFSTLRTAINFRNRKNPIQMDMVLNGQHGMNESRAIVYDSVGVGLGHYRYDPLLNEYIRDDNGSYVAHTVLTGDLDQGFRMDGRTRFIYDFSRGKFPKLKSFKYRFNHRLDYHGAEARLNQTLMGEDVQIYQRQIRNEIIHRRKGEVDRRRLWQVIRTNFNGMDPRGWEKREEMEWGGESQSRLKQNYHLVIQGDIHDTEVSSEKNRITGRTVKGYTAELGFKDHRPGSFQWDTRFIYYQDDVTIGNDQSQSVQAHGLKTNWIQFIGEGGRIEGRIDFIIANGFDTMPPEALNGLADNRTIRMNITASMRVAQAISINGTLLYQDDARYNSFIKMRGEVRAHF